MAFSPFQFTEPLMTETSFQMRRQFKDGDEVKTHLHLDIRRDEHLPKALVELTVQLNKQNDQEREDPCFVAEVKMQSVFTWSANLEEETVNSLLNRNAPALLLSYARPIVSHLTSASPLPTYNIPFINMNEMFAK